MFIEWCSCNAHNLCLFFSYSTFYVLNLWEIFLFMHVTFKEKIIFGNTNLECLQYNSVYVLLDNLGQQ